MASAPLPGRKEALADFVHRALAAGPDSRAIAILETDDDVAVWANATEVGKAGLPKLLREYAENLEAQAVIEDLPASAGRIDGHAHEPVCDVCGGEADDTNAGVDKVLDMELGAAALSALERGVSHEQVMTTVARGLLLMAGPDVKRIELYYTDDKGAFSMALCAPTLN